MINLFLNRYSTKCHYIKKKKVYKQKVDTEGKAMGQPANKIAGELAAELSFVATGHIMPLYTHPS